VRVIGSLAVLAAAAFAVGAGAGLLWKAPGLVLAQWGGETQEVAWADVPIEPVAELAKAGSGPLPEVDVPSRDAAAPARDADAAPYQTAAAEPVRPLAQGERRSAPAPAPKLAPAKPVQAARAEAATPPVSAAPPGGMAVQVGAFADRRAADQLIAKLESKGFAAYAAAADGGAWRVRVGPYKDRPGAEKAAAKLKQDEKLPTWVLEETGDR
jgi:cell division protein FtsN